MKTRFDSTFWMTAQSRKIAVEEMETDHLLNTLKMLIQKPLCVINMLIRDIEDAAKNAYVTPWVKDSHQNAVTLSIRNVTSMTADEAIDYALNSCLGKAMWVELVERGVNVENYLSLLNVPAE